MSILFYRLPLLPAPHSPPYLTNGIGQNVPLGKNCYGVQMNRGGRGLLSKETVVLHQWGSITR